MYVLSTAESNVSGRTIATPSQPSVKLASDDEEDSPLISSSLTSGDEENPITPTTPQPQHVQVRPVRTHTVDIRHSACSKIVIPSTSTDSSLDKL